MRMKYLNNCKFCLARNREGLEACQESPAREFKTKPRHEYTYHDPKIELGLKRIGIGITLFIVVMAVIANV